MKSKHKPHRHPPQPRLMSHKAEANKSLVIGIIAVIAIVGLGLLLFFSKQFVGKAIHEAPISENQAGFFVTADSTVTKGTAFVLPVKVKIGSGKSSVAGSFEFTYPAELLDIVNCNLTLFKKVNTVFVIGGNDLTVFKNYSCSKGKVSWQFAGLCNENCSNALLPGPSIDITEIRFYPKHAGQVNLTFTSFDIIDLDTGDDLVADGKNAVFNIVEGAPSEGCGNGLIAASESCDDGNTEDGDGCSSTCAIESEWNCAGAPSKCCSDSDKYKNLTFKGWATGFSETTLKYGQYNDSCTNLTSIVEMTCVYVPNGSLVRVSTQDCPGGGYCSDGACIAPFCPAGKVCCGGTTEINLQTDPNYCGTCGNKCSLGQTCQNGVCTGFLCGNGLLETGEECDIPNNKYCTATNCKVNSSYLYGDLNLDGNITTADWECFSLFKASDPIPSCLKVSPTFLDFNCDNKVGLVDVIDSGVMSTLTSGGKMPPGVDANGNSIPDCKETKPITIELTSKGNPTVIQSSSTINSSGEYTIKVTIAPQVTLPKNHLLLATVSYGSIQKTYLSDSSKPALAVGQSESLEFTHQGSEESGNMTIKAYVWSNWPSANGIPLIQEAGEATYVLTK